MLFQPASSSCSCAVSPQSPALSVGHQNEMLESASCRRVTSARSAFVDWRRSRVCEVDDLDAAPVRGAVGAAVADGDVAARVAGAEGEAPRRRRHRLEHQGRRQLGDLGRPVHAGPRRLEQVQRLGALEPHADGLEDVQRRLLEPVQLLRRVILTPERRLDGLDRRSLHGCHARLPVAVGHSYQTGRPRHQIGNPCRGFCRAWANFAPGRPARREQGLVPFAACRSPTLYPAPRHGRW